MGDGRWRRLALGLLGLAVLGLFGACSGSDGRHRVTGTVTVDGKPLADGSINFRPAPGLSANSSGGPIQAGRFDLPAQKGLLPGTYLVTIQATKETGRMVDDEQMGKVAEKVPVKFRESGKLEATVVAGQKAHFDFQLTSAD